MLILCHFGAARLRWKPAHKHAYSSKIEIAFKKQDSSTSVAAGSKHSDAGRSPIETGGPACPTLPAPALLTEAEPAGASVPESQKIPRCGCAAASRSCFHRLDAGQLTVFPEPCLGHLSWAVWRVYTYHALQSIKGASNFRGIQNLNTWPVSSNTAKGCPRAIRHPR